MKESWYIYTKKADFAAIAARYHIDPVVARVLRNRDVSSYEDLDYFFFAGLGELYDERLIPDLERAAAITWDAVRHGKKIRIVGDYDIDGVSATYILLDGLRALGGDVDCRVPERIRDGYGININIIREAYGDQVELILTCDNGIAAIDEIGEAVRLGVEVVVTDHHDVRKDGEGRDILPPAAAVADVKRADSLYPTREICGAVVAWKLLRSVYRLAGRDEDEWFKYLEFAAIATVGDIMELRGENRIIVREGLGLLSKGAINPGLRVLIDKLGLGGRAISAYHVGFVIGPVINAGGRLETARSVLRLFLTDDEEEAGGIAGHLIALNEERKAMTEEGVRKGVELIEEGGAVDDIIIVYIPELHESLAGIVAGRLKERYHHPCFVITDAASGLKGSGRSIEGYDMFKGLCEADKLLTKYGGHPMAAGVSLEKDRLPELRCFLNERSGLGEEDFREKIWVDAPMPLGYVSRELIRELEALAPFGHGFKKAIFADKGLKPSQPRVLGRARNALRFTLCDASGRRYDAIMFGEADTLAAELMTRERVAVLYYPEINSFRGLETLQFHIESFV